MARISRTLLLVAILLAAVVTATVAAEGSDGVTGADGIEYETSPGNAYVTGYSGTNDKVTIPSQITVGNDTYPVTGINNDAFKSSNVTEIHIPASVAFIDNSAFYGCTTLKLLFIEGSPMIGSSVFMGCTNLEFISLGGNPVRIGANAFALGTDVTCTVRAPQANSLDSYGNGTTFEYISMSTYFVSYTLSGAPEGVSEVGYDLIPGDTVLSVPTRAETEGYDISMSFGTTPVESGYRVSGDIDVTLNYTIQSFDITFMNGDEVFHSYKANYFSEVVLPEDDPTKAADAQFTYTFAGWEGYTDGMEVKSAITFNAVYLEKLNHYTITFISDDVVVKTDSLGFGEPIVLPEDPVKEPTETISYTFTGWEGYTGDDMKVSGEATFTAIFSESDRLYKVRFLVDDTEYASFDLKYEETITPPATNPTKEQDPQFTYAFSKWDGYTEGMKVVGDVSFRALFDSTQRSYTIVFESDGLVFDSQTLAYGATIVPPATNPTKAQDAQYTYTFAGWEGYTANMTVTDNAKFVAKYDTTVREYTIVFESDGDIVKEDVLPYGATITPPAKDPVREPFEGTEYRFAYWFGYTEGMTVTGDQAFTARFYETDYEFTITFVSEGVTVSELKLLYGAAIPAPTEVPTKASTDSVDYRFAGWEGYTEGMTVTDDATFTAQFDEVPRESGSIWTWVAVIVVVILVVLVALFVLSRRGMLPAGGQSSEPSEREPPKRED